MRVKPLVCFHGQASCVFCWPSGNPTPLPVKLRRRCAACGRFVAKADPPGPECPRCVERGFKALVLF